ncbi:MAG: DUF4846 domain-containing protein [Myxococcota bacterium]
MFLAALMMLSAAAPPWPTGDASQPLSTRLKPPTSYRRKPVEPNSFAAWLRTLPVKPGRPEVRLFDGRRKAYQHAQWLVLDVDVGRRNLQQCADAVMRLYAEWQWAQEDYDRICFRYTSGHRLPWAKWAVGYRPKIEGRRVSLVQRAAPSSSYTSFRRYLRSVFTYAGTASLARDLPSVSSPRQIQPGDVFIKGGFPGHAVIVVDVVENEAGHRKFALAQSYMPAQDIHVLRNPASDGPWFSFSPDTDRLRTPEWTFDWSELKRFSRSGCPARRR